MSSSSSSSSLIINISFLYRKYYNLKTKKAEFLIASNIFNKELHFVVTRNSYIVMMRN